MTSGLHANGKRDHRKILKADYRSKVQQVMELFLKKKQIRKPTENEANQSEAYKEFKEKLDQTDYNLY